MLRKHSLVSLLNLSVLLLLNTHAQSPVPNPDPLRFQSEINAFIWWDQKNSPPADAVLFIGSSSIRMWKTHESFPNLPVINRGFGGAHISDILYFYNQIIQKYDVKMIIFYCGDNDIAAGKSADQVFNDYQELIRLILLDMPDVKFLYLSIKPSVSRWNFWNKMSEMNQMVQNYNRARSRLYYLDMSSPLLDASGQPDPCLLLEDGLHLNEKGYKEWNKLLNHHLSLYH
ncbi:hypothetical protein JW835_14260 [bacterium]|nr:hypothetical protein [bacterium]